MQNDEPFINYYSILQVKSNCDIKILEAAYRYLAKMYHPDHKETADVIKFNQVIEAYRCLRDPEKRTAYDLVYAQHAKNESHDFSSGSEFDVDQKYAIDDADLHAKILLYLYKTRRERAHDAGVAGFYLQEMLNCSYEHFEFHRWYLKAKGLIEITEQGTLAITVEGVDHVISMSKTTMTERLFLSQASKPKGRAKR